jgi:hypothetical protein
MSSEMIYSSFPEVSEAMTADKTSAKPNGACCTPSAVHERGELTALESAVHGKEPRENMLA